MKTISLIVLSLSTMTLAGCVDTASEPSESLEPRMATATKATFDYYTVRNDLRRCAFPLCGGWFISSVNTPLTTCDDGSQAAECYVAELSVPEGLALEDGDLIHGQLSGVELFGSTWGRLEIDVAYASVLEDPWPYGIHSLFYDTGIMCVTTPCPSMAQAVLNTEFITEFDANDPNFFFWGNDTEEDAILEEAFWGQYADDTAGAGVLTFGEFWDFWGETYYSIYNVYAPKPVSAPVCVVEDDGNSITARNFASTAQAEIWVASLAGEVSIASGSCADQLAAISCSTDFVPVHGSIDAHGDTCQEHSNACQFRTAVIVAAGQAGEARGQWSPGSC